MRENKAKRNNEILSIAMFGHKRLPSREGGIEVVVKELAVRMASKGHNVTCYSRAGSHVSGSEYDVSSIGMYKGVKVVPVWTIKRRGLAAVTSSLSAALKAAFSRARIVHIHAEGPAAMCWIPKLMRKKVIVTIHGLDWARCKWGRFAAMYIKYGEKMAVKHADEIIVLSNSIKEYFKKEYNRDTVYIPNAVDEPTIKEANKITNKWGLTKDSYVLFLGRIVPEKGIKYLIDAWKDIKTDKKLVIVGGSSDTQGYMNELKDLAGNNVIFTGFLQGSIIDELYSNAYLYCLFSDLEGMPLTLLEAMSYGDCCVVSDIAECKEVVGNHAVIVKQSDEDELREKLQWLIDNEEEVAKYRNTTAEYVLNKYKWDDVVNKTLEVYRKVLSGKRHADK